MNRQSVIWPEQVAVGLGSDGFKDKIKEGLEGRSGTMRYRKRSWKGQS